MIQLLTIKLNLFKALVDHVLKENRMLELYSLGVDRK